jgi:hypothetical protein
MFRVTHLTLKAVISSVGPDKLAKVLRLVFRNARGLKRNLPRPNDWLDCHSPEGKCWPAIFSLHDRLNPLLWSCVFFFWLSAQVE